MTVIQDTDTTHQWRTHPSKASVVTRPMTNGELIYQAIADDGGETIGVFTAVFLKLDRPVELSELTSRLRDAWCQTRDAVPLVATHIARQKDGQPTMLEFTQGATLKEVKSWADLTTTILELDDDRITPSSLSLAQDVPALPDQFGNNALLRCYVPKNASTKIFDSIALGIWVNHELFDAPSSRVVLSELRQALAKPQSSIEWGTVATRQSQVKRLCSLTTSLLDGSQWPTRPAEEMAPAWGQKLGSFANNLVHVPRPTSKDPQSKQVVFSLEQLTPAETQELQVYCRKHSITATPFLLAALVIRTVLELHQDWPIPPEATYVLFYPCDPRATLKNKRAVGVHSAYSITSIPLGKLFEGKSRSELIGNVPDLIRRAAQDANVDYASAKPLKARADAVVHHDANLAPFIAAIRAKQIDFSSSYLVLYADGTIGMPTIESEVESNGDGIGSKLTDLILYHSGKIDCLVGRAWALEGRTNLLVSGPGSFMSIEYAQATCKTWKEDVLEAISTSE